MRPTLALITGATSGFGKAIAEQYAALGVRTIICGRRKERLEALADALGRDQCYPLVLDVRDKQVVAEAIASLPEAFQPIDVLVNNAGLALGVKPVPDTSMNDWEQMIDTNIKGLLYVTEAVLPGMIARGRGHIINMGSMAGTYAHPGGNCYGASKAFVQQFSLNLRADLLGTPIRVTNIEPGLAETEFSLVRLHGDEKKANAVYDGTEPLTAENVAECVVWSSLRPANVNINRMEIMPTCQATGSIAVHRHKK